MLTLMLTTVLFLCLYFLVSNGLSDTPRKQIVLGVHMADWDSHYWLDEAKVCVS